MPQEPTYPLFVIEREAVCWIASAKLSDSEVEIPHQWQLPKTEWALPAFFMLYPADNPQGFCVEPASTTYYDWHVIEKLGRMNFSAVCAFLDWHTAHLSDKRSFIEHLESLLSQPLAQQPDWDFDACNQWIREQRRYQDIPGAKAFLAANAEEEPVKGLTNKQRVGLLALSAGLIDSLAGGSGKAIAEVVSDVTGLSVPKTTRMIRARDINSEDNPFAEKNLQQLFQYLKGKGLDKTALGAALAQKLTDVKESKS